MSVATEWNECEDPSLKIELNVKTTDENGDDLYYPVKVKVWTFATSEDKGRKKVEDIVYKGTPQAQPFTPQELKTMAEASGFPAWFVTMITDNYKDAKGLVIS